MTDTIKTKNELKSLFENGDIPSGSDFNDLITTFVSLSADQTIQGKSNFNDEVTFNDIIKITNLTPNQAVILNDQNVLTSTNFIDPSLEFSLRFNNINVYDVAGDTGDKNMGGDLGLQFIIMPISDYQKPLIKSEDNDYYYYDLDLILQEAYGGNVNIYSGIQVTYSNTTGGVNTETQVMGLSTRYSADGNKGLSHRRFNIQVPKNYLSQLVTYVRFDVMCGRQGAGSTGIVGAQLRFN